jgi:hypothetical protein
VKKKKPPGATHERASFHKEEESPLGPNNNNISFGRSEEEPQRTRPQRIDGLTTSLALSDPSSVNVRKSTEKLISLRESTGGEIDSLYTHTHTYMYT